MYLCKVRSVCDAWNAFTAAIACNVCIVYETFVCLYVCVYALMYLCAYVYLRGLRHSADPYNEVRR